MCTRTALLCGLLAVQGAPDGNARLVPREENKLSSSTGDDATEVVWVTEGAEEQEDKGPTMLSAQALARSGLTAPARKDEAHTGRRKHAEKGRAVDVHARAEVVTEGRVEGPPGVTDPREVEKRLKTMRPGDIFPEDEESIATREADDQAEVVVISDGTQEGIKAGFAAEAAAATAAAPRPEYPVWDKEPEELKAADDDSQLPGRQKALKEVPMPETDDPCDLPRPPGIGSETDEKGKPRWSRFYTLRDVCVTTKPQTCGSVLPGGFGIDNSSVFEPLDALSEWLDVVPAGCKTAPRNAERQGTGLAFTIQHYRAFQPDSILHQASSALALDWDAAFTRGMQPKLAHTSSVLLPQFASREQLETTAPWMTGMFDVVLPRCVLPHACPDGKPQMRTCDNLTQSVCFDELLIHRQVGPFLRRDLTAEWPSLGRKFFPEFSDARRFQRRAAETLGLPKCPPVYKRLTLTLAIRRDGTGYSNPDEMIGKVAGLVSVYEPWFFQMWEPKAESLAVQARRLACTDLLVIGAGEHATNMIFMPPRSGVIYTARCGCRQQSGFMHQTAAELGLRWWDVVEDCAPGQSNATCDEAAGAASLANVKADVDANWKGPILRALDEMRVWNNTRGGMWSRDQDVDDGEDDAS
jgi:hypothetical protein